MDRTIEHRDHSLSARRARLEHHQCASQPNCLGNVAGDSELSRRLNPGARREF